MVKSAAARKVVRIETARYTDNGRPDRPHSSCAPDARRSVARGRSAAHVRRDGRDLFRPARDLDQPQRPDDQSPYAQGRRRRASAPSASPSLRGSPRTSCAAGDAGQPRAGRRHRHGGRGSPAFIADMLLGRAGIAAFRLACRPGWRRYMRRACPKSPTSKPTAPVRDRGRERLDRDGDRHHERRAGDHRRVRRRLHLRDLPRLCRRGLDRDRRRAVDDGRGHARLRLRGEADEPAELPDQGQGELDGLIVHVPKRQG